MSEAHRALVREHLGLEAVTLEPVGDGWDCFTYLVDGAWIVQIPRLPGAEGTTRRQIDLLPELAKELPARIPVPERVCRDPVAMAYRRIEGEPLDPETALGTAVPERLGRFLFDLHAVAPELVGLRSVGPEVVREAVRGDLARFRQRVVPLLARAERRAADRLFDTFVDDDANFRFATAIAHADLGPAHVLVREGGLAGVIDWGDAKIGDPAIDHWWIAGHPAFGERVLAAYGGAPDPRFRFRAETYFRLGPWHEVVYGLDTGHGGFVESGLAGVRERLR